MKLARQLAIQAWALDINKSNSEMMPDSLPK